VTTWSARDAREIAYQLVGFKVEALYAYRAQRRVFAVFGRGSRTHAWRASGRGVHASRPGRCEFTGSALPRPGRLTKLWL
jgi:hypothetical protein